jgi:isoquinoline 1-oxidoreductase alpha subunit
VDDEARPACKLLVSEVGNQSITTIEGLSENGDHPVQQAWLEHDVSQCGYCQPGQIMRAASLLKKNPNATDEEIEKEMNINLCRCGAYLRINAAIKSAGKAMQKR